MVHHGKRRSHGVNDWDETDEPVGRPAFDLREDEFDDRNPKRDSRDHRFDPDGDLTGGFRGHRKDRRRDRWRER